MRGNALPGAYVVSAVLADDFVRGRVLRPLPSRHPFQMEGLTAPLHLDRRHPRRELHTMVGGYDQALGWVSAPKSHLPQWILWWIGIPTVRRAARPFGPWAFLPLRHARPGASNFPHGQCE
jgi:hypothetical protein